MAARHKRRGAIPGDRIGVIEREFQKGHVKQALKDVKVAYREAPSDELRVLFARVSVARAKELLQQGLRPQAQDVVQELLSLGETDPSLRPELASVLVALGMVREQARLVESLADPQAKAAALASTADTAVLHAAGDASLPPEARADAAAVRQAIDLFEAGRDDEALAAVRDLSRQSLLADWKLFLRGFAAWRRRDPADTEANWRRLIPGRLPARCAALLSQPQEAEATGGMAIAAKEVLASGAHRQAFAELMRLKSALAQDDLEQAFAIAGKARVAWRQLDSALPVRVEAMLYDAGVRSANPDVLRVMSRHLAPPPLDPRWNRAHALAAERVRWIDEDIPDGYWQEYLTDLATLPALAAADRALAQALVLVHRGENLALHASSPEDRLGGRRRKPRRDRLEPHQKRAVTCFEKARELAPDLLEAYTVELQAIQQWELPARAAETAQKLLDRFPEHFETLVFLANHRLGHDDALPARDLARRAHRLKPLDREVSELLRAAHQAAARHYGIAGDIDRARQELDEADKFATTSDMQVGHWVHRCVLESKAGNPAEATSWFDRIATAWGDPLPILLARSIEARRYRLAREDCERFAAEWRAAAANRKITCLGIGQACEILATYLRAGTDYPGRADDVKSVATLYVRNQKKRFSVNDMRRIAGLLELVRTERGAFEQLVARGVRKYPKDPFFLLKAAEREIARGPYDFRPHKLFPGLRAALAAAEKSTNPDDRRLAEEIRSRLKTVEDVARGPLADFGFNPDRAREILERILAGEDVDLEDEGDDD